MQENNIEYAFCAKCHREFELEDIDDDGNCFLCARKIQRYNRKQMIDINLLKSYKANYKK
jgi:DNA-directed RNA polymerase subunit RPC12/RpoP